MQDSLNLEYLEGFPFRCCRLHLLREWSKRSLSGTAPPHLRVQGGTVYDTLGVPLIASAGPLSW